MNRKPNMPLVPMQTQLLSLQEFQSLDEAQKSKIKSARVVPPTLGSNSFGMVLIEWKTPVYVSLQELTHNIFSRPL